MAGMADAAGSPCRRPAPLSGWSRRTFGGINSPDVVPGIPAWMPHCIFCDRSSFEVLAENEYAFSIRDRFPVRRLHTLVLPKRHESDGLLLSDEEITAVFDLARQLRSRILEQDATVGGFNFGLNDGAVAGQKVLHAHFHLIPRRADEAPPPPAQA